MISCPKKECRGAILVKLGVTIGATSLGYTRPASEHHA